MASRLSILPIAYLSAYLGPGYLCNHTYGNGTRNMRICALGLPAEPTPAYVLLYVMYIPLLFSSVGTTHLPTWEGLFLTQYRARTYDTRESACIASGRQESERKKEKAEGKPSNPRGGHLSASKIPKRGVRRKNNEEKIE
ncbi:hypothetical protein F4806DRAFT_329965 [Annulohypoxylon nitens]|nr:hypothetical protein F4806DRAFT_329965 [Annulohypoxylon nitens]